jgi:hypothetical protein
MATEIYKIENIKTIDGKNIEIIPLKIKYMREFMDVFSQIQPGLSEEEIIDILCDCSRITMKQYAPEYSNHLNDVLDNFDLKTIFNLLDFSAGIKMNRTAEDKVDKNKPSQNSSDNSWEDLDLAKLETEVFLLGIWKSYDDLETSLSMTELFEIISTRRELDYEEKKFLAGIQGINLEGNSNSNKGQKEWEDMKARVFSGGATSDSNDILALQGQNAIKAGFGIGMGLEYEKIEN